MLSINNTTTKSLTNVGGLQKLNLETDAKPNVEKTKPKPCAVYELYEGESTKRPWKEGDIGIVHNKDGSISYVKYTTKGFNGKQLYFMEKDEFDARYQGALESNRGDIRK